MKGEESEEISFMQGEEEEEGEEEKASEEKPRDLFYAVIH